MTVFTAEMRIYVQYIFHFIYFIKDHFGVKIYLSEKIALNQLTIYIIDPSRHFALKPLSLKTLHSLIQLVYTIEVTLNKVQLNCKV